MQEKEKKMKKAISWKRVVLIVLCVILSLVLALLVTVTALLERYFGLINNNNVNDNRTYFSEDEYEDENQLDYDGPSMDEDDVQWGEDADPIAMSDDVINILLIGQDRREGEGRARSDAMILCTINKKTKTITMSSFMRDMYVQIPGYSDNRINASYAFGGMELLDATLEKNFGVTVDGNVEVDFSGFQKVIDTLGGVEIELTSAEARYLNRRGNWDVEDNAGTWSLTEGVNLLNGSQALAFSRIRNVGNGDFGRTNRQRTVLNALLEKAKSCNISQLHAFLEELLPLITTDLTDAEIMGYAVAVFPMLGELEFKTQQIPADGAYTMTMIREMSVLLPNLEKNRAILAEIITE